MEKYFYIIVTMLIFSACNEDYKNKIREKNTIKVVSGSYLLISARISNQIPNMEEKLISPKSIKIRVVGSGEIKAVWSKIKAPVTAQTTGGEFHINSKGEYEDTILFSLPFAFRLYGSESQYLEMSIIENDSIIYPEGKLVGVYRKIKKH